MKNRLYAALLTPFILLLTGCIKQLHVSSSTFANTTIIPCGFPPEASFSISSNQHEHSLFIEEISQKISDSLMSMGYVATTSSTADFYLSFHCDTTSSQELISVPKYIPGQEQITYGTGHISGHSYSHGDAYTPFGYCHSSGSSHSSGSMHYQEITTTSDSIVYVPETITLFTHKITIEVYQINAFLLSKKKQLVWQGSAVCCDRSSDRRYIIDYLLKSVLKHFGRDTKKNVHEKHTDWF